MPKTHKKGMLLKQKLNRFANQGIVKMNKSNVVRYMYGKEPTQAMDFGGELIVGWTIIDENGFLVNPSDLPDSSLLEAYEAMYKK